MINLQVAKNKLQPGDPIQGTLRWSGIADEQEIEVRLLWFTEGKGTRDYAIASTKSLSIRDQGEKKFVFTAPKWPLSFSGQFISLRWVLEVVELDSEEATQVEVTIGPDGSETILPRLEPSAGQ